MKSPATELGEDCGCTRFLGEDLEISFGHVKLGLPIQYKNENVEWVVGICESRVREKEFGVSSMLENHETG